MPGSPPASPNFNAPRFSDSDDATFSQQVNAVTDTFDALAVRRDDPRLTDQRLPPDGGVSTAKLANGAVTGAKIAANTITEANLAAGSVGSAEIIDGTIQSVDLADAAITLGKLAAASVSTGALVDGAVTIGKLAAAVAQAVAQPGFLQESIAGTTPPGWLVCDGSQVSRVQYAALFAAIGTTWGAGDGATTFALPDLRGRCMIGSGAGTGLTARALGGVGGEEAHVMSLNEMPSHGHGVNDPTHAHAISDPGHAHQLLDGPVQGGFNNIAGNFTVQGAGHASSGGSGTGIGIFGAATGISIVAAGAGVSHNNMQPFAVVTILIKT